MGDFPRGQINVDAKGNLESVQYSFAGMNFFVDPADITIESGQCPDIQNCDIDYAYNVSRRSGSLNIYANPIHCLWQGDIYTYCVSDGLLCKFIWGSHTNSVSPVLTQVTFTTIAVTNSCEFKQVNSVVYYSDGTVCGIIEDDLATKLSATALPTEAELVDWVSTHYPNDYAQSVSNFEVDAFKRQVQPGTCIEYFNGVLYYAINNFLYCTKAFDAETEDIRFSVVGGFPSNITMVARVSDGLYVSTNNHIYFLEGTGATFNTSSGNLENTFKQRQVAMYGTVKGSSVRVNATIVPDAQAIDTVVLCTTSLGIFALCNGGRYVNLSASQITMPTGSIATAILKEDHNLYQYIVCYNVEDSIYGSAPYAINTSSCIDTVVLNTINLCHSRYTNFAFNSFIKRGLNYYGACQKGVYVLIGDEDYSTEVGFERLIDASITTPISDFNQRPLKQVTDAYIHGRINTPMYVDVTVNEGTTYTNFEVIYDAKEGIHRRRVKIPRGLQGADWQFKIKNTNGGYFTIFDFELHVKNLKRII